MSWKNVKEHYRIGHIVHIRDGRLCIGSPYISEIIVVSAAGEIEKRYTDRGNEDLSRYQAEMDADPAKLLQLIQAPDTFSASVPVFTYDGAAIIEKRCEALGWPNVTHDGCLMYENTFSPDKAKVIAWAKRNAALGVDQFRRHLADAEARASDCRGWLATEEANLAKLNADYP